MAQVISTGAGTYMEYGTEDVAYATVATTIDKVFGYNETITITADNNMKELGDLNTQDLAAVVPGVYGGSAKLDFTVATPWFFKLLVDDTPAVTGGPAYIDTYTPTNTLPSFSVEIGEELGTTDSVRTLLGCKVIDGELTAAVGEPITATLNFEYANETEGTILDGSPAVVTAGFPPHNFAQASLTWGGASAGKIENFTIKINRNTTQVPAIGSRHSQDAVPLARRYEATITVPFEAAATFLEDFYGSATGPAATVAEKAAMVLTITNGLAAATERSITLNMANLTILQNGKPIKPNEITNEDLTIVARTLTDVVAVNATAAHP